MSFAVADPGLPSSSATSRRRESYLPALTGRSVGLGVAFSVVVLIAPVPAVWALVIVNAILLVLVVVDWVSAPNTQSIAVERDFPPVLALDGEGTLIWTVSNPGNRRLHVSVADELAPSLRASRRRFSAWIPSGGRAVAQTTLRPARRGKFEISEIVVRVVGPLGLAARQGRREQPEVLAVYPSFHSKKEAELRIEKARILEVGLRSVRAHGGGTEFDQLREYNVDDDFRRIDWAATARALKPIVRTYRAEQNQNVVLLLDTGRVMAGKVGDVPRLEHAMDAVMALSTVAARLGDRVGLIAFDKAVRAEVAASHGPRQVSRITEAMYQLEPELVESDYRGAFVHTLSRFRRRSLVVLLTEPAEHAVRAELLPALPLLGRDHLVVIAGVTDPEVSQWARAMPAEANKAFRKAAAVGALEGRRRTVALLRSRGATVVDAVPGKLAAQLCDAYLKVKATGTL